MVPTFWRPSKQKQSRSKHGPRRRSFQPAVEALENRWVPSTAYLATDLASAKIPGLAYRLLSHVVPAYSDVELVALSSYLEAGRQRDLAVHAYALVPDAGA